VTTIVLVSALGILIVISVVRLLVQAEKRRSRPSVTADEYANAREALGSVFIEAAIMKRIFSVEDADFMKGSATPVVKCLFLKERKTLALNWFRKTRKQVATLMDIHLRLVSYTHDPNPGLELSLTVKYLSFLIVSNIVLLLVWLLGPFRATRSISYAIRTAGSFFSTFNIRLERVKPASLNSGPESLVH
jgi:hypothetical protein